MSKLKTFDSSYFIGKSYFEEDGTQNYLVFQSLNKYFKVIPNDYVSSWKSKGLSAECIKPPTASNNRLNPQLSYYGAKTKVEFDDICLKQEKVTFNHGKTVSIYTVYEIIKVTNINGNGNSDLTIQNALFGAVSLTKKADIDKYKYCWYGIGFDRRSLFSYPKGGNGQNVIIFGVDMSSSMKIDNKKKRYFDFRQRSNARSRTYAECRKNVFD